MNFSIFLLLLYPPLHFSRNFLLPLLLLLLAERMNLPIHNAPPPPTFSFAFFSRQPLSYLEQSQKKEPSSSAIPFFPRVTGGASHQTEWPSSRRTAAACGQVAEAGKRVPNGPPTRHPTSHLGKKGIKRISLLFRLA